MSDRVLMALAIAGSLLVVAFVARVGLESGPAAPRVNLQVAMDDMHGARVDLSTFAGRPLVINLWATWCGPCRIETPQLVALANEYRAKGVTFLGISVDDPPDAIRAFAAEYDVSYPMLVGAGQEAFLRSLGYQDRLPFSVLVAPDGLIVGQVTGLKTTAAWQRSIDALLR